jgi:hypothetical protein
VLFAVKENLPMRDVNGARTSGGKEGRRREKRRREIDRSDIPKLGEKKSRDDEDVTLAKFRH